ncbi:MAG: methionine--tRNA ligase subunit beta [Candidatus Micrarchaeia archaeon]
MEEANNVRISYDEFSKIDLRVAKIINVEEVEGLKKLYKLTLDVGEAENRTILAGIKKYYTKEELINRNIVIVANLEPKEIAGLKSNGMLLAASDEERVVLLTTTSDVKPGSKIS